MATPTVATCPKSGREARVVKGDALAVLPPYPSKAFNAELAVADTAYTIISARGSESFYITGIILTGNKNISVGTDATVTLYEATANDLTAILDTILLTQIAQSSQTVITGINIEVSEGRFVVGKTSDDDVFATILGYYI